MAAQEAGPAPHRAVGAAPSPDGPPPLVLGTDAPERLSVVVSPDDAEPVATGDAARALRRCRNVAGPSWEPVALCRAVKTGEASACIGGGWLCELAAALSPVSTGLPQTWLSQPHARAAHAWLLGATCDVLDDPAARAACLGAPAQAPPTERAVARAIASLGVRDGALIRCPAPSGTPSQVEARALCLCRELAGEECPLCYKFRVEHHAERCPVKLPTKPDLSGGHRVTNPTDGPLACRVSLVGRVTLPVELPPGTHRLTIRGAEAPPFVNIVCMPR